MLEQRLYDHIDWLLLAALLLLSAVGGAMVYSTTYDPANGGFRARPSPWPSDRGRWR